MDFQDSLKASFKTKDDVDNEKKIKEQQHESLFVDISVKEIEQEILKKAGCGEYELINGEEIIKCLYCLKGCWDHLDRDVSYDEDTITVRFNERHTSFIENLRNRLFEDNICITREYLASSNPRLPISKWEEHECPAVEHGVKKPFLWTNSLDIIIECQTIVPKEYSEEFKTVQQEDVQVEIIAEVPEIETNEANEESTLDFDSMEGNQFERFCTELLLKNGFVNVEQTKGSGDQGIDIIAFKDGVKFGIQCKRYSSDVGNKAVQEVFTGKAYYHCNVAAILTNSHFTQYAKELAKLNNVVLWDRGKLLEFIENAKI